MLSTGHDDVISSLPDAVLCHILSFLETKEVVATSVLSKRWTRLWDSVPLLNFFAELSDREAYFRFNEFVYSVLLAHKTSIKRCTFDILYDNYHLAHLGFPNVIKWINAVVQCGVERLYIYIESYDNIFKLPISILSCKTLVVLDISTLTAKGFSSVRLPSLKILRLNETNFLNVQDLVLLLAGCPILEELLALHLEFDSDDSLTYQELESLSLNKLRIANLAGTICHFPLKALHNVELLDIEINKVYRSFDDISTFHNLTNLRLYSNNCNMNLLVKVLKHCPNLQNVELKQGSAIGMVEDVMENWVDPTFVPQCLSLQLKTCIMRHFLGQESEIQFTRYILKNARVLQTMKIHCGEDLEIEKELSLCPRASSTCELIIIQ
ncbi:F-box/FBD/LRR-repeat protein At5g53840-like [Trifolium pratense]|uniref:F-box/FBD/LRR-repeat protein At5g53840-like n=1 Tax=Trifolium pratense TaxID=57577 RepID=UPI001E696B91|nr:F-box/FBD/LRR-repeat protein At5g53840-like [Trifolium pratense]